MRRPRDLWASRRRDGVQCVVDSCGCESLLAGRSPTPRQYRRVASWLRKVADWYDHLATKKEGGR